MEKWTYDCCKYLLMYRVRATEIERTEEKERSGKKNKRKKHKIQNKARMIFILWHFRNRFESAMYNDSECEWGKWAKHIRCIKSDARPYTYRNLPQNSTLHAHVEPLNLPLEKCRVNKIACKPNAKRESISLYSCSCIVWSVFSVVIPRRLHYFGNIKFICM